jgi:hypothetical protein
MIGIHVRLFIYIVAGLLVGWYGVRWLGALRATDLAERVPNQATRG